MRGIFLEREGAMSGLMTTFDPAKDGFQFSNSDILWELHAGASQKTQLCGGMIYTALDHWHSNMPMPASPTPPPLRTPLSDYIFWRQASAHVYTVTRLGGGTIFPFTQQWFVDSVAGEFDHIRAGVASNNPIPLFLVKDAALSGHHVLAIGCQSSPSNGNPIVHVYDPTRPGVISEIHVDYKDKHFWDRAPGKVDGMYLRGFFADSHYKAQKPPVFPP